MKMKNLHNGNSSCSREHLLNRSTVPTKSLMLASDPQLWSGSAISTSIQHQAERQKWSNVSAEKMQESGKQREKRPLFNTTAGTSCASWGAISMAQSPCAMAQTTESLDKAPGGQPSFR